MVLYFETVQNALDNDEAAQNAISLREDMKSWLVN